MKLNKHTVTREEVNAYKRDLADGKKQMQATAPKVGQVTRDYYIPDAVVTVLPSTASVAPPPPSSSAASTAAPALVGQVREATPPKAYALLAGAFFAGQYEAVAAAFEDADAAGREELGQYRFALLRGRNAGARFLKYASVDRANVNGWPTAAGAQELRRLAGICTKAYEQAFRAAPSRYERGRVYCLWHTMLCEHYFDADSKLLRNGSPLVQPDKDVDHTRLNAQAGRLSETLQNALYANEHAREMTAEARKAFADVFLQEYRRLATIGVPDAQFARLIAGIGDYTRLLLTDYVLDHPDKARLTIQYYLWRAIAAGPPDVIERAVIDARVEEFAAIIEKQFDAKVQSPHLPGGRPDVAKWWRKLYADHRDNPFFMEFQVAPLAFRWARRNRKVLEKDCPRFATDLMADLVKSDNRVAQIAVEPGSEQYQKMQLASEAECRDKNIHYFTQLVKQMAIRDLNWYVGPSWQGLPGKKVVSAGGSGNFTTGMWTRSVGKVEPMDAYPVRKALTSAESRQMDPR